MEYDLEWEDFFKKSPLFNRDVLVQLKVQLEVDEMFSDEQHDKQCVATKDVPHEDELQGLDMELETDEKHYHFSLKYHINDPVMREADTLFSD